MKSALAAGLIASLAVASPRAAPSETPPATIRVGYLRLANAQLISKALRFHERSGLTVQWIPFETGGQVNAAIAAGQIDFGAVGSPPAAAGISAGLQYRGIFILNMLGSVEGLVVRANLPISAPSDLAGRRIAVPFGSTSYYLLLSLLRQNGVPRSAVTLLDMTPSQAREAWDKQEIDGAWLWETALHHMMTNGGRVLVDNSDMARSGLPVGDIAVVANDLLKARPELVARYVQSECAAIEFWRERPADTARIVARELGVGPADAARMMTGTEVVPCGHQLAPAYLGLMENPGAFARSLRPIATFLFDDGRTVRALPDKDYDHFVDIRFLTAISNPVKPQP